MMAKGFKTVGRSKYQFLFLFTGFNHEVREAEVNTPVVTESTTFFIIFPLAVPSKRSSSVKQMKSMDTMINE